MKVGSAWVLSVIIYVILKVLRIAIVELDPLPYLHAT